jgi:hypothetical protein
MSESNSDSPINVEPEVGNRFVKLSLEIIKRVRTWREEDPRVGWSEIVRKLADMGVIISRINLIKTCRNRHIIGIRRKAYVYQEWCAPERNWGGWNKGITGSTGVRLRQRKPSQKATSHAGPPTQVKVEGIGTKPVVEGVDKLSKEADAGMAPVIRGDATDLPDANAPTLSPNLFTPTSPVVIPAVAVPGLPAKEIITLASDVPLEDPLGILEPIVHPRSPVEPERLQDVIGPQALDAGQLKVGKIGADNVGGMESNDGDPLVPTTPVETDPPPISYTPSVPKIREGFSRVNSLAMDQIEAKQAAHLARISTPEGLAEYQREQDRIEAARAEVLERGKAAREKRESEKAENKRKALEERLAIVPKLRAKYGNQWKLHVEEDRFRHNLDGENRESYRDHTIHDDNSWMEKLE